MTRTSTRSVRVPPRRSNSCSWRTRRSLAWVFGAHVADLVEEQRAAVGLLEAADALLVAPVNAPFSCPNSSDSSRFSWSAAQFTLTKLRPARSEL